MSETALRVARASEKTMEQHRHAYGLRTVAVLEGTKGVLVLLLGFGVLALLHKDLDAVVERIIDFLHLNPDGKVSDLFFRLADRTTDKTIWILAFGALVYSIVRFIEAYGLWHERDWAEWFAMLSGCMYLPWELYEVVRHPHPVRWAVLLINLLIVLYIFEIRVSDAVRKRKTQPD